MSENVGFYPTTQLNPYTTTIGSEGTYQSIMSYIYGASSYEVMASASAATTSTALGYSGLSLSFKPTNSQQALILYDIFCGNNAATVDLNMSLYIDSNAPPASGSAPPATATQIDSISPPLGSFRSQTLLLTNSQVYGGANSGTAITLSLNTTYYLTWYISSVTSGSVASLQVYGLSIQSI
jgi:hypothetical protein